MTDDTQARIVNALESIAFNLDAIVDRDKRTLRMVDVERGNVYKTHLGGKLSQSPDVTSKAGVSVALPQIPSLPIGSSEDTERLIKAFPSPLTSRDCEIIERYRAGKRQQDQCPTCGFGYFLPSGVCDHCNTPRPST